MSDRAPRPTHRELPHFPPVENEERGRGGPTPPPGGERGIFPKWIGSILTSPAFFSSFPVRKKKKVPFSNNIFKALRGSENDGNPYHFPVDCGFPHKKLSLLSVSKQFLFLIDPGFFFGDPLYMSCEEKS